MNTTPPSLSQIGDLPVVLDIETAGRLLGIGRSTALKLAGADQFPCRVLRVGNKWRVPTADLLAILGLTTATEPADSDNDSPLPPPVNIKTLSKYLT
jgi:hypothetical protein